MSKNTTFENRVDIKTSCSISSHRKADLSYIESVLNGVLKSTIASEHCRIISM